MLNLGDDEEEETDDGKMEHPWQFWKWLIPMYAAVLCVSILLFLSYFITVFRSSEFLLYIGNDNKIIWHLLPAMPCALMFIEYPFNMIPLDWPMLIFVELLFTFYIFVNFLIVSFEADHTNIYEAFDWYNDPGRAVGTCLVCYAILAVEFAFFWGITQRCKLPRYEKRREVRFESFASQATEELDNEEEMRRP